MIDFILFNFKKYFTLFLLFLCLVPANAQHEKLLDSLKRYNSFEQRRIFYGYIESRSTILNTEKTKNNFLETLEKYALANNQKALLKEIEFIRYQNKLVYSFPKEDWLNNLEMVIKKYKRENQLLFLAYCYHEKGQIEFNTEKYQEAFESNLNCLEILNKVGYRNVPKIGKIVHEIALNYYFFKDYKEVIRLMRISIQFPPFSRGLDMQRYNNLGVSYQKLQNTDSSIYFYKRGFKIADSYQAEVWKGLISANLGELYYEQNKLDSSFYYFKQNYSYNQNERLHSTIKINAVIDMAKIYLALEDVPKAVSFLNTAEGFLTANPLERYVGDKQQIEQSKLVFYQTKIKYLKKIGDFKNALILKDSVIDLESKLYLKYNSAIIKLSEKEITIAQKEDSLIKTERKRVLINYLYSGLLLTLLLGGSIGYYHLYRSKIQKKRQSDALIAQNKVAVLEKKQSKKELEVARKEMQFFISKISEQNKRVTKLELDLEQSKTIQIETRNSIEESMHKLKDVRILTNENWIDFQENFDTLYPQFRFILKNETPTITASEMRYLMLTQLQFSHKEMALALGVSASSMRVTWNRVRKRLNGTLEDTPQSLLHRIMDGKKTLN